MKIAVTANGWDLDSQSSPIFGRCATFVLVDTDTMTFKALANPSAGARGGAGIQAAQYILQQGAEAILSGNVGPNALGVLQAGNVPVYLIQGGTVRQVVEAFKAGRLRLATESTLGPRGTRQTAGQS